MKELARSSNHQNGKMVIYEKILKGLVCQIMSHSEPIQTFKMGFFAKIANDFQPLTKFSQKTILDVWPGSENVSACVLHLHFCLYNIVFLIYLQISVPRFCTCVSYLRFCLSKSNYVHNQTTNTCHKTQQN